MKKAGTTINFTVFDAGTVMQDDVTVNSVSEHMNTWRVAYNITTIREWLFEQTND
jgi:predicted peptidase